MGGCGTLILIWRGEAAGVSVILELDFEQDEFSGWCKYPGKVREWFTFI